MWRATNSGRVLEHVDEAVQFAQDVVRHVARGARLAVEVDRDVGVAKADLLDKGAQVQHRGIEFRPRRELLVVDRQDEGRGAALLLRELRQVAVTGHPQHFHVLVFYRLGQRAYAQPAGVLGAEVFVDDDDGKAEFHSILRNSERIRARAAAMGLKLESIPQFRAGDARGKRTTTAVRLDVSCASATGRRAPCGDFLWGASAAGFPLGHRRAQDEALVCGPAIGTAGHAFHCGVRTQGNFGRIIPPEGTSAILDCGSGGGGGNTVHAAGMESITWGRTCGGAATAR